MRPIRTLPALLLSGLLASCSYTVTTPPARCAELIPRQWAEGVAGAPLPSFLEIDRVTDPRLKAELESRTFQKAWVDQSARLEIANQRTADLIFLYGNCERVVNEARDAAGKQWWQFWR